MGDREIALKSESYQLSEMNENIFNNPFAVASLEPGIGFL